MDRKLVALGAFATLGACTQPAANSNGEAGANAAASSVAEAAIPDLKGTWVGTGESIVTGTAPHHAAATGPAPLLDNVEFTFVISGQDRHRFWGSVSSARGQEPVTGVVEHDGKTIVARDKDGEIHGTLSGPDTIDLIYDHGGSSTVIALNTITRRR